MDQNNGIEPKTSKEEIRTILTMELWEILPLFIRISLQDHTSHMGTTIEQWTIIWSQPKSVIH